MATKKTTNDHYSILILPSHTSSVRRFEVSRKWIARGVSACIGFSLLVVGLTAGLIHYRSAYLQTEQVRVDAASFQKQQATLVAHLVELEHAVGRTERFASLVSEVAADHAAKAGASHGPISEEDWLPMLREKPQLFASLNQEARWRAPFSEALVENLNLKFDELDKEITKAEGKLHGAFAQEQDRLFVWASLPTTWPARGWLTSEFGDRRGWRWHEGIDIASPIGSPILASGDGFVTYSGYRQGYGRTLIVDHGYGVTTLYGHCSEVYIPEGTRVKRGMVIASVGNTGRSTGPHLHYEIHVDGVPVDPLLYILDRS